MEDILCENCKNKFDESKHLPMTLPCSHPMCLNCINTYKPNSKFLCPKCSLDISKINLKELKPHQMILSIINSAKLNQSSQLNSMNSDENMESDQSNENEEDEKESNSNKSSSETNNDLKQSNRGAMEKAKNYENKNQIEYCLRHKDKEIEFFCQTCTTAVCSLCIFETHNGHHWTLLEDMSTIIKNNVKDFGKIWKNLEKVNEDNQSSSENKLDDVDKQKQMQWTIVTKSFDEILKKIESTKNSILEEFNNKYFHEIKRFKKIQTCLQSNQVQIERIAHINEELTKNFENFSDAKILKKIDEFTSFLHKSAMDIKRLYKTEISLKAELIVDPAMKPIPINVTDLIHLLEKIDPKTICYPYEDSSMEDTDTSNNNGLALTKKKYIRQNLERPSFDNEINNYINRIGPVDSSLKDSDIEIHNNTDYYNTDDGGEIPKKSMNFKSAGHRGYKIPRQRSKWYLKQSANNNGMMGGNYNNNSKNLLRNIPHNHGWSHHNAHSMDRKYYNGVPVDPGSNMPLGQNGNNFYNNPNQSIDQDDPTVMNGPMSVSQVQQSVQAATNHLNNNVHLNNFNNNSNNRNFQLKYRVPSAQNRHVNNMAQQSSITLPNIKNTTNSTVIPINPDNSSVAVYCFGEAAYCWKYYIVESNWEIIKYTNEKSKQLGQVRYSSICTLPGQKMWWTGGCKSFNDEATNICLEINSNNINDVKVIRPMNLKRYGHSTVFLNSYVYSIGGYEHSDKKEISMLSTWKNTERYDLTKKKWETMANLNHPRAFFGSCMFKDFIFVFGGVFNSELLSSIEKYDTYTNIWITYHIKLPEKLAQMGALNYKNDTVILWGGMNADFNLLQTVQQGKLESKSGNAWFKAPDMLCPRAVKNTAFYYKNNIIVLGGSVEGICEQFDFATKKWGMVESYQTVVKAYKMEHMIKNITCAMNYFIP